jgi:hypothetical protein
MYDHQAKPTDSGSTPKLSAKPPQSIHTCENLTLHDWLIVVDYHDKQKPILQWDIVAYFAKRSGGALIFTQSSLSHHLSKKGQEKDQKNQHQPQQLCVKRGHVL